MPPTLPATVGRPFQSASVTVRPKPSRIDFCRQMSDCDWKALTSIAPTLLRLLRILMSSSPSAYAKVFWKYSIPSGSSVAIDAELAADEGGVLGREGHVLRRERVDRRRHDPHGVAVGPHVVGNVIRQ